jgi:hypothetical protein
MVVLVAVDQRGGRHSPSWSRSADVANCANSERGGKWLVA